MTKKTQKIEENKQLSLFENNNKQSEELNDDFFSKLKNST